MSAEVKIVEDNGEYVARAIPSAIDRALEQIGILAEGHVMGYMTQEHIVDTGRLRNSITHSVRTSEKAVYVGTNVEYGKYVHNGTRKMAGRPFLVRPVTEHGAEYRGILKKAMES